MFFSITNGFSDLSTFDEGWMVMANISNPEKEGSYDEVSFVKLEKSVDFLQRLVAFEKGYSSSSQSGPREGNPGD